MFSQKPLVYLAFTEHVLTFAVEREGLTNTICSKTTLDDACGWWEDMKGKEECCIRILRRGILCLPMLIDEQRFLKCL